MNKPLVSVIMPVYNGEKYIKQAVDSVYEQGVSVELLVIDDGSTDHTQEVLSAYEGREDFRYLKNKENMGAARSRNRGVQEARGEYIAFLEQNIRIKQPSVSARGPITAIFRLIYCANSPVGWRLIPTSSGRWVRLYEASFSA